MRSRKRMLGTAVAVLALLTAACGSDDGDAGDVESTDTAAAPAEEGSDTTAAPAESEGDEAAAGGTLIVGKSFDLKTLDPGRQFETTGAIIVPAIYDTLLTFVDNDVTTPVPSLAESWEVNDDATEFTLTMRADATFSDGSPVTAEDAAFSLNRVRELKGNGSFLMEGVTAEAIDDATLKLTSEKPNPALPRILPTPTLAVLNSEVVIAAGGTADVGADASDTAEESLNTASAGSGPYLLESFSVTDETIIVANPDYWGDEPAAFERIVFRNIEAATQAIDIQNGNADIAVDLARPVDVQLAWWAISCRHFGATTPSRSSRRPRPPSGSSSPTPTRRSRPSRRPPSSGKPFATVSTMRASWNSRAKAPSRLPA